MNKRTTRPFSILLLAAAVGFAACATIATYNAETFRRAAVLKAKTMALMNHADEPYSLYSREADSVVIEAHTLYAMSMSRAKNEHSVSQWKSLIGDRKSMLTGFLALWKRKDKLSETVIDEETVKIMQGFDEILTLEGAKLKN